MGITDNLVKSWGVGETNTPEDRRLHCMFNQATDCTLTVGVKFTREFVKSVALMQVFVTNG